MPQDTQRYLSPSAIERIFGRLLVAVIWIGLVRGHFYVLEVRGRKSGRTISLPVDPIEIGGRRYLVCARGNSNWVRNARAAGEVALVRALRRRHFALRELPPSQRPPVLKAYSTISPPRSSASSRCQGDRRRRPSSLSRSATRSSSYWRPTRNDSVATWSKSGRAEVERPFARPLPASGARGRQASR